MAAATNLELRPKEIVKGKERKEVSPSSLMDHLIDRKEKERGRRRRDTSIELRDHTLARLPLFLATFFLPPLRGRGREG